MWYYVSSPRHILLLPFLPKAFVEFIGSDKTREHTCTTYIVRSNNGSVANQNCLFFEVIKIWNGLYHCIHLVEMVKNIYNLEFK
jgi:hypothetical protein